jgi:hypothetical protein
MLLMWPSSLKFLRSLFHTSAYASLPPGDSPLAVKENNNNYYYYYKIGG